MFWTRKKPQFHIGKFLRKAAGFDAFEIRKYMELYDFLKENAKEAEPQKLGLKLLVVSDTHGYLAFEKKRFPDYLDTVGAFDLCVLLGDIHPAEMPLILDCVPRDEIIAVKGNHDSFSLYRDFGVRDISGTVFAHKGVRFAGIDGSFRYKNECFPSHTQYDSLVIARNLPEADVLITHDIMLDDFRRDPAHAGLIGIADYVYRNSPQYHIHGHIHRSYEKQYDNGTKEKSVYLCECIGI